MARPRKPSDPNQWPIPCGRCGEHHQIAANWPDGGVCGLLVEHGALPRRDELTVRYAQWATSALARVSGDDHRDVVRRFIRWQLQRRMNRMETVTAARGEQGAALPVSRPGLEFEASPYIHGL
jgi:hypothetical protein